MTIEGKVVLLISYLCCTGCNFEDNCYYLEWHEGQLKFRYGIRDAEHLLWLLTNEENLTRLSTELKITKWDESSFKTICEFPNPYKGHENVN